MPVPDSPNTGDVCVYDRSSTPITLTRYVELHSDEDYRILARQPTRLDSRPLSYGSPVIDGAIQQFLSAWTEFEAVVHSRTGRGTADAGIKDLESSGELSDSQASQLHGARLLRNALTHTTGAPLAVPSSTAIDLLLVTTSRLSGRPPTVGEVASRAWAVSLSDRLDAVLEQMQQQDFSQAPIQDGPPRAMFTLEQVTRWLWLHGPTADTSKVTVAEVADLGALRAAGQVKESSPTQKAVDLLVAALDDDQGATIPVLLVGSHRNTEQLRLFTLADLPRAMRSTRPLRTVTADS